MKKVYRLQIDATHNGIQRHLSVLYENAEYAVKILNKITNKFRKEWSISTENQWDIHEYKIVPRYIYKKNDGKSWYYYNATIYEELMLNEEDTIEYMCGEVCADNDNPNIMGFTVTPIVHRNNAIPFMITDIIDVDKKQRTNSSFLNGYTIVDEDKAEQYYNIRKNIILSKH